MEVYRKKDFKDVSTNELTRQFEGPGLKDYV